MAKPDKPQTPQSEKMQAKVAKEMFSKGSAVKASMGGKYLGDQKRDNRSVRKSMASAGNAYQQKNNLIAQRRRGGQKISDEQSIRGETQMMASSGSGGKSRSSARNTISNGVRSVARTGSVMSSMGNQDSMRKFVKSNRRKQAMADIVQAGVSAYAQREKKPETKKNDFAGDNIHNYDDMGDDAFQYLDSPPRTMMS